VDLLFPFGPQPRHRLTLAVEVNLHLSEPFYDGLDTVPELGCGTDN
jgi:hypothetical protein